MWDVIKCEAAHGAARGDARRATRATTSDARRATRAQRPRVGAARGLAFYDVPHRILNVWSPIDVSSLNTPVTYNARNAVFQDT